MSSDFEREYDDEVYEDDYYDEHFDEEELTDDEENEEEEEKEIEDDSRVEDDWDDKSESRVEVSYACEDCDYRWEDVVIKRNDSLDEVEEIDVVCPMCGSTNITQI